MPCGKPPIDEPVAHIFNGRIATPLLLACPRGIRSDRPRTLTDHERETAGVDQINAGLARGKRDRKSRKPPASAQSPYEPAKPVRRLSGRFGWTLRMAR